MKYTVTFLFLVLASSLTVAQEVPVVTFAELQKALNEKPDEVKVVNFWASWCKPCLEEMPVFQTFGQNNRLSTIQLMMVSLDFTNEQKRVFTEINKFELAEHAYILNAPDANAWIDKIDKTWNGTIPATFIKGPNGQKFIQGKISLEELEMEIKQVLKSE